MRVIVALDITSRLRHVFADHLTLLRLLDGEHLKAEILGGGIALVTIFSESALDHGIKLFGIFSKIVLKGRWRLVQDLVDRGSGIAGFKGQRSRQQFIEHYTGGED